MRLGAAVLAGKARAYGRLADIIRERGGTYYDTFEAVRALHERAGKAAPTLAEFEEKMLECEAEEQDARR